MDENPYPPNQIQNTMSGWVKMLIGPLVLAVVLIVLGVLWSFDGGKRDGGAAAPGTAPNSVQGEPIPQKNLFVPPTARQPPKAWRAD